MVARLCAEVARLRLDARSVAFPATATSQTALISGRPASNQGRSISRAAPSVGASSMQLRILLVTEASEGRFASAT